MPKQSASWNDVQVGDIISFRYKSKSGKSKVQTILVLNPKLPVTLKDGKKTWHLIGVKLEEAGKIQLRLTGNTVKRLEKIGDLKAVDEENGLYRLEIFKRFVLNDIKGIRQNAYNIISESLGIKGKYRTYTWLTAKKSSVSLEPIKIFTKQSRGLEEQEEEKRVKINS